MARSRSRMLAVTHFIPPDSPDCHTVTEVPPQMLPVIVKVSPLALSGFIGCCLLAHSLTARFIGECSIVSHTSLNAKRGVERAYIHSPSFVCYGPFSSMIIGHAAFGVCLRHIGGNDALLLSEFAAFDGRIESAPRLHFLAWEPITGGRAPPVGSGGGDGVPRPLRQE